MPLFLKNKKLLAGALQVLDGFQQGRQVRVADQLALNPIGGELQRVKLAGDREVLNVYFSNQDSALPSCKPWFAFLPKGPDTFLVILRFNQDALGQAF